MILLSLGTPSSSLKSDTSNLKVDITEIIFTIPSHMANKPNSLGKTNRAMMIYPIIGITCARTAALNTETTFFAKVDNFIPENFQALHSTRHNPK